MPVIIFVRSAAIPCRGYILLGYMEGDAVTGIEGVEEAEDLFSC